MLYEVITVVNRVYHIDRGYERIENILLVEDNEINLEIMHSQLTSMGYTVDKAVNGRDALVRNNFV